MSYVAESGLGQAAGPAFVAGVLSILHVGATARAAPKVLRVRQNDDGADLRRAFRGFERWQAVRAVLQLLAFGASVWALVALLSS